MINKTPMVRYRSQVHIAMMRTITVGRGFFFHKKSGRYMAGRKDSRSGREPQRESTMVRYAEHILHHGAGEVKEHLGHLPKAHPGSPRTR